MEHCRAEVHPSLGVVLTKITHTAEKDTEKKQSTDVLHGSNFVSCCSGPLSPKTRRSYSRRYRLQNTNQKLGTQTVTQNHSDLNRSPRRGLQTEPSCQFPT